MADEHRTTPDIENKSVLVTGGAHGIGEGVARALSALGAHVTIADIDADRGHSVAADIDGQFISTDVSEYDANIAAVQAATRRFGTLDIAILNAGVISNVPMGATFDPDQYRRAMGINLDGVVFGINAALPALLAAGGGDIIVTASMAGIAPTPLDPVYAANKTGLVGLVRSFGLRSVHDGIRTNAPVSRSRSPGCLARSVPMVAQPRRLRLPPNATSLTKTDRVRKTRWVLQGGNNRVDCRTSRGIDWAHKTRCST